MRSASLVSLVTAAALAAGAAPAAAAVTSSFASGVLTVTGDDAGDTVSVTCAMPGNDLHVNGADPSSGPLPCSGPGTPSTLSVAGNGGVDTVDLAGIVDLSVTTATVDGGDGDDLLTGVSFTSNGYLITLLGGPGSDTLTVNNSDVARGGPGDDRIVGPASAGGTLDGEAGTDTFAFTLPATSPANFGFAVGVAGIVISAPGTLATQTLPYTSVEAVDLVLADAAETVDAAGFPGRLTLDARGGADTITGSAGADVLTGGEGNDFIDAGGGADTISGAGGLDLIHARDGVADTVDCGTAEDTLQADATDAAAGCERVDLPPPPPVPPDTSKPSLGVLRAVLTTDRRLRVALTCPATETRCAGLVRLAATGRRKGKAVTVRLGAATIGITGGATRTVSRRVTRAKARVIRRLAGARLRVSADIVDGAGNRARQTRRVRLQA